MALNSARLDRYISEYMNISRKDVRLILAQKRVLVDGVLSLNIDQIINSFSVISIDGKVVQENSTRYIMLNKPTGVVSATKDTQHKTVIDLLPQDYHSNLHIVGRLDLNSSGLLLLTNDSRWSSHITEPTNKIVKKYRVTLAKPLSEDYIEAFRKGMYFEFENITTQPATLEIISEYVADVYLIEGRYHQIKRMFGRFRNQVLSLHRLSIGTLLLDPLLASGESRFLTIEEINSIKRNEIGGY